MNSLLSIKYMCFDVQDSCVNCLQFIKYMCFDVQDSCMNSLQFIKLCVLMCRTPI